MFIFKLVGSVIGRLADALAAHARECRERLTLAQG